jgi:hypothetical protein
MQIYLSPHHDDVCFSIGSLACRLGGDLVNLFTRSCYVAVDMELPSDQAARVEVISQLRREEDCRFTEAVGLVRHDLGLWEPVLMGRGPFDVGGLEVEVGALTARLLPFILSTLPREGDPSTASLYCPMGIGGHRNHVSTLLTVRNAFDTLRRRCTVFLYEDLHYASNPRARQDGVRRATRLFAGTRFSPIVMPIAPLDSARKMQLISLYASQHPRAPQVGDFIPASGLAHGPHEIIWKISA